MATYCSCSTGLGQLFVGGCEGIIDISDKIIAFSKLDSTGQRNGLDITTNPIPATTFQGLFKNSDTSKRWHITPTILNPTWTPNEANMQTFDGGEVAKLSDGTTVMTFMVTNVTPQEAAKFKKLECGSNDVMITTQSGQLVAYASLSEVAAGKVYGLPVQNISVLATPMKTNASVSQVTITITFKKSMDLGKIVTIDPTEMLVDWTTYNEPKGVKLLITGTTTTTVVNVKAIADYYNISGSLPIVGLGVADFVVTNLPSTTVTPSSVVESPNGTYAITYAAQTSGDDMTVNVNPASTNVNLVSNVLEYQIP